MKSLFLFLVLVAGGVAQAQAPGGAGGAGNEVSDAIRSGQVARLNSLADLSMAAKLTTDLIIAIDVEKKTPESDQLIAIFAEIAKAKKGEWVIVTADEEELKATKSSLAGRLNATKSNVDMLVTTAKSDQTGYGGLTGSETDDEILAGIDVISAALK